VSVVVDPDRRCHRCRASTNREINTATLYAVTNKTTVTKLSINQPTGYVASRRPNYSEHCAEQLCGYVLQLGAGSWAAHLP